MTRIPLIILAFLIFTSAAHALVIEFKPTAAVDGVSVTLGDIAVFDEDSQVSRTLATQLIAQAPSPGQQIDLQTRSIIQYFEPRLKQDLHIDWRGAETVRVTRNAHQVSSANILGIIDTFLQQKKDELPEAEIRFIPAAQPLPFIVPPGELSWEVIPSDPEIVGSKRFAILFKVDGRLRKNMSVRGHLEVLAPVVVATGDLRKGTILTPQHLTTAVHDIGNLKNPCLDGKDIVGKKLTRSVRADSVILLPHVDFPPMVRKGELVRIILKKGTLLLTANGVARTDGKQNQTIRVQNTSSQKILYCRVTAPGLVEVTL
jgi:flagella basal body P-ring formation protein FlgA